MKFTLVYDGELRANDDYKKKWEIRKKLHPQLEELWRVNQCLRTAMRDRHMPVGGGMIVDHHHSEDETHRLRRTPEPSIDLCASIEVGGRHFLPLVRESFSLRCGLKIVFLRVEEPGRVYQGGDLDNRLKTFFDALSLPNRDQIVDDPSIADPIYCVMEDDALIAAIEVETHRLLAHPDASKHTVRILLQVDVRVTNPRSYNYLFLGD